MHSVLVHTVKQSTFLFRIPRYASITYASGEEKQDEDFRLPAQTRPGKSVGKPLTCG